MNKTITKYIQQALNKKFIFRSSYSINRVIELEFGIIFLSLSYTYRTMISIILISTLSVWDHRITYHLSRKFGSHSVLRGLITLLELHCSIELPTCSVHSFGNGLIFNLVNNTS